jgi:hypothetical protein
MDHTACEQVARRPQSSGAIGPGQGPGTFPARVASRAHGVGGSRGLAGRLFAGGILWCGAGAPAGPLLRGSAACYRVRLFRSAVFGRGLRAEVAGPARFVPVSGSGCSPLRLGDLGLSLVTASLARRCRAFDQGQRQQRHSDAVSVTSPGQRCRCRAAYLRHLRASDAVGAAICPDPVRW